MTNAAPQAGAAPAALALRAARESDAYALWLWANDPETRLASFGRGHIAWPAHLEWLAARLQGGTAMIAIAESPEQQPVGTIRFETGDGWATTTLSYVIAPEARGRGLARRMVEQGVRWLLAEHPAACVTAEVADANERSLRIFRGAGWREARTAAGAVIFTWDPAP